MGRDGLQRLQQLPLTLRKRGFKLIGSQHNHHHMGTGNEFPVDFNTFQSRLLDLAAAMVYRTTTVVVDDGSATESFLQFQGQPVHLQTVGNGIAQNIRAPAGRPATGCLCVCCIQGGDDSQRQFCIKAVNITRTPKTGFRAPAREVLSRLDVQWIGVGSEDRLVATDDAVAKASRVVVNNLVARAPVGSMNRNRGTNINPVVAGIRRNAFELSHQLLLAVGERCFALFHAKNDDDDAGFCDDFTVCRHARQR